MVDIYLYHHCGIDIPYIMLPVTKNIMTWKEANSNWWNHWVEIENEIVMNHRLNLGFSTERI